MFHGVNLVVLFPLNVCISYYDCSKLDEVTQFFRQSFIVHHACVTFLNLNKSYHHATVKMYGRKACNQLYCRLNTIEMSFLNACTLYIRLVETVLCLFCIFVKNNILKCLR